MNPPQAPAYETIDQLCQCDCAFAICRAAGNTQDQIFMQHDGLSQPYQTGDALEARGFIIAPYGADAKGCFIREERGELPTEHPFKQAPPPCPSVQGADYAELFQQYHGAITKGGGLKKLVLARCEDRLCEKISPARAYEKTCQFNPHCFCALIHHPQLGTWLVATPELLIKGEGSHWRSMALAGTQQAGGQWSHKNKEEHQWVSLHCEQCLQQLQLKFQREETKTLCLGEIEHLCTPFTFQMQEAQLPLLLQKLPPTPAVCGYPLEEAKAFINKVPDINRQCYAGYLGYTRAGEETQLYVTLRCMQLIKGGYRLYAGGGIMPESELMEEMAETSLKMGAMEKVIQASFIK